MSTVIPIFVAGSARSGTTWLSNLLAAHPAIAAAHHRAHWGAIESEMYRHAQHAGDLRDEARFRRFLDAFATTDLFRALQGDKQDLERRRPTDMYQLMFELFDAHARRTGATHWTTKLDPALLYRPDELARFLGRLDARYARTEWIGIERDARDVVASYLEMEGQRSIHALPRHAKALATVLESGRYVIHNRGIDELVAQRGGLKLTFSDLRADERGVRRRLSEHLGLDLAAVDTPYRPNSSHGKRPPDPSTAYAAWVADRVLVPAFRRAPALATAVLRLRDRTRGARSPFYWRLLQLEQMPEQLARELLETGQDALHEALFGDATAASKTEYR